MEIHRRMGVWLIIGHITTKSYTDTGWFLCLVSIVPGMIGIEIHSPVCPISDSVEAHISRCKTHCCRMLWKCVRDLFHKRFQLIQYAWWRHQMETFSALLAICAGNSPVSVEFPTQKPVTRSFDVFFDLRLNKRLSKQSWRWGFQTLSLPLWRHRNGL